MQRVRRGARKTRVMPYMGESTPYVSLPLEIPLMRKGNFEGEDGRGLEGVREVTKR